MPETEKLDKETLEIMNNPKTMRQIRESLKDIEEGRYSSADDLFEED